MTGLETQGTNGTVQPPGLNCHFRKIHHDELQLCPVVSLDSLCFDHGQQQPVARHHLSQDRPDRGSSTCCLDSDGGAGPQSVERAPKRGISSL